MTALVDLVDEDVARGPHPALRKQLGLALLFFVGALGFAEVLRRNVTPYNEGSHQQLVYDHYARHSKHYDTLFFGSSKVRFHLDPRVFDREMKAAGAKSSSFNYGIPALNGFYTEYVVKEALALAERPPRRVIVDVGDLQIRTDELGGGSEQVVAYNDTATVLRYLKLVPTSRKLEGKRWEVTMDLLRAWARRQVNLGLLSRWSKAHFFRKESRVPTPDEYRGYDDLDARLVGPSSPTKARSRKSHEKFMDHWEKFEASTKSFQTRLGTWEAERAKRGLNSAERGLIERLRTAIEATGARAYFVITPRETVDGFFPLVAQREGVLDTVFEYSHPERFPEFFSRESRFDGGHLSREGAVLLTRLLARDVARAEGKKVGELDRAAPLDGFEGLEPTKAAEELFDHD